MIKPNSLRNALSTANPFLAHNPDKLHIFIDSGRVVSTLARSLSYEYQYTLTLIITDCAAHPDALMVPIVGWLRLNQPELLLNPQLASEGIQFECEFLNDSSADISIKLKLTERVIVREQDGKLIAEHVGEPPAEEPVDITWQLYLKGVSVPWPFGDDAAIPL